LATERVRCEFPRCIGRKYRPEKKAKSSLSVPANDGLLVNFLDVDLSHVANVTVPSSQAAML